MDDRALVVGAGIAGLAAAIALRRTGREVIVLERAAELREVGAGVSLWPNAVHALRRLGVAEAVEAAGAPADDAVFRTWRGPRLGASITAQLSERFGAPLVLIHRARLQSVLRRAFDPGVIRLGAECAVVTQSDGRATVHLARGGAESAAVVIGADGLHSRVRDAIVVEAAPRYAGITAWRGVVPVDDALGRGISSGESFGRGSLFGIAALDGSQVYWWAGARRPESEGQEPAFEKASLLRAFADWHAPISDLIAATPPDAIIRTRLYERSPLEHLGRGRIGLVGDAAHPMLPNLGQGACQAIEDAVALADALAATPDVVAALAHYSALRAERTADVVRASRQMSRIAHLRAPLAAPLRNAVMRASPASLALRRLAPILGHGTDSQDGLRSGDREA
jgi:2-polyprenyl-6-methoxyphenol hydroxylase-like FAD-dependent oxidoreductase